jgi:hypothetical protein
MLANETNWKTETGGNVSKRNLVLIGELDELRALDLAQRHVGWMAYLP